MKKFDTPYIDHGNYPIRLDDFLEKLCNQVGIQLGSKNIVNANYIVLGNPFTNGESCKTVLENISELACGFARIENNDCLYIKTLLVNEIAEEEIDGNNYDEFSKNNIFGTVNSVKIKMNSGVDGEETVREEANLTEKTRCQISIINNYFLINEAEREKVIDNIYNAIKGLNYLPFETTYYGYPWLVSGDKLNILDVADISYPSYVFNHTITYNGGFSGKIQTPVINKNEENYNINTNSLKNWKRNTELKVDKINGKITSVIEEQSQYEEKLTTIEQDVNSIKQNVGDIVDYKREVNGFTEIHLLEAGEMEIIKLEIGGSKVYKSDLFPSSSLFPIGEIYPNIEGSELMGTIE